MFSNRLNLINVFAVLMLSIAVLLIAIGGQFFSEVFRRMAYYNPDTNLMNREEFLLGAGFLTFGLFILFLSIGLIQRWKWARVALQVTFALAAMAWAGFTFYLGLEMRVDRDWIILAGVGAIGLGTCLFALLFLGNDQVKQHFHGEEPVAKGVWEVLDE